LRMNKVVEDLWGRMSEEERVALSKIELAAMLKSEVDGVPQTMSLRLGKNPHIDDFLIIDMLMDDHNEIEIEAAVAERSSKDCEEMHVWLMQKISSLIKIASKVEEVEVKLMVEKFIERSVVPVESIKEMTLNKLLISVGQEEEDKASFWSYTEEGTGKSYLYDFESCLFDEVLEGEGMFFTSYKYFESKSSFQDWFKGYDGREFSGEERNRRAWIMFLLMVIEKNPGERRELGPRKDFRGKPLELSSKSYGVTQHQIFCYILPKAHKNQPDWDRKRKWVVRVTGQAAEGDRLVLTKKFFRDLVEKYIYEKQVAVVDYVPKVEVSLVVGKDAGTFSVNTAKKTKLYDSALGVDAMLKFELDLDNFIAVETEFHVRFRLEIMFNFYTMIKEEILVPKGFCLQNEFGKVYSVAPCRPKNGFLDRRVYSPKIPYERTKKERVSEAPSENKDKLSRMSDNMQKTYVDKVKNSSVVGEGRSKSSKDSQKVTDMIERIKKDQPHAPDAWVSNKALMAVKMGWTFSDVYPYRSGEFKKEKEVGKAKGKGKPVVSDRLKKKEKVKKEVSVDDIAEMQQKLERLNPEAPQDWLWAQATKATNIGLSADQVFKYDGVSRMSLKDFKEAMGVLKKNELEIKKIWKHYLTTGKLEDVLTEQ